MLLVDNYGYKEMKNMTVDHSDTITLKPEIAWTDYLVVNWLFMGAIIFMNMFIGQFTNKSPTFHIIANDNFNNTP